MRPVLAGVGLVALLVYGARVPDAQQPSPCDTHIDRLEAAMHASLRQDGASRARVLDDVLTVIQAAPAEASACAARLRDVEMTLVGKTDDLARLDSVLAAFFEGPLAGKAPARVTSRFYRQRGYLLERRGRTSESAQAYFNAARLADQIDVRSGAVSLFDAALSAQQVGRPALTVSYVAEAERLIRDSLDAVPPARRPALDGLLGHADALRGSALFALYQRSASDRARRDLAHRILRTDRSALAVLDVSDEPFDRTRAASVHFRDAIVLAEQGDRTRATARVAQLPARVRAASEGVSFLEGAMFYTQGEVARLLGQLDEAEVAFREARRIATGNRDREQEVRVMERLGRVQEARNDLDDAEVTYRQAVSLQEALRERVGLREWSAAVFHERQQPYRGLSRVHLAQGDPERALVALDASQARAFRDLRRFRHAHRALPAGRRLRVDALVDSLEAARLDASRATDVAASTARATAYEDSLAREVGVQPLAAPPLDLARLQSQLQATHRRVLVYSIDDVQSTVFVIAADTLAAVPLTASRHQIADLATALVAPWQAARPDPAADLEAAHALYQAVVEPAAHLLPSGAPVTVIPDDALAGVPFGSLVRTPSESYRDADYLVRHHAFGTDLAASLMLESAARDEAPRSLVALGVTTFQRPQGDGLRSRSASPLPHVRDEIERIREHVQTSTVALDSDATESALETMGPDAGIVHLATHTVLDPVFPMNSHVVLHDDPRSDDDGLLHLHELQNHDLNANLVVLSGCSTAQGEFERGEGLMGLGYAVRAAGALASIATLWAVDDQATVFVMDRLYAGLAKGLPKDEALREAQIAYLDGHDGIEASPFYWAAPVLSGAPAPVPVPGIPWLVWGGLLALVAGLAWWRTRRAP